MDISGGGQTFVDLVIKSPSTTESVLRIRVPLEGSVLNIKEVLSEEHPERPPPASQRLIFAGHLLKDSMLTAELLKQHDISEPQTLHLMLPPKPRSEAEQPRSCPPRPSRSATAPASQSPPTTSAEVVQPSQQQSRPIQQQPRPLQQQPQPVQQQPQPAISSAGHASSHVPALPSWYGTMPTFPPAAAPSPCSAPPGYQFVVQEWYGQPYVFAVPAIPSYFPLPGMQILQPYGGGLISSVDMPTPESESAAAGAAAPSNVAHEEAQEEGVVDPDGNLGRAAVDGEENAIDYIKLALKLVLFVYILGQDAGNQRLTLLCVGALLIYLAHTGYLDFVQRLVARAQQGHRQPFEMQRGDPALPAGAHAPPPAAQSEAGAPGESAGEAAAGMGDEIAAEVREEHVEPLPSLWRDVESTVGAFFTSLFPSYHAGLDDNHEGGIAAAGPGAM